VKRPDKPPTKISESLHHRLNAYALAASAAGVGVLALAQPARARVVYTPAHVTFTTERHVPSRIPLDLNHDGIVDFSLVGYTTANFNGILSVAPINPENLAMGYRPNLASALPQGFRIGPTSLKSLRHNFGTYYRWMLLVSTSAIFGSWDNLANRYLGLKFVIKGKVHYGWARLSVASEGYQITATLTGYAYETIPNKPIIAGQTHGKSEATLGRLAQGASGVSNGGKP
jgi:hypothetical protein